ncbi:MAG TPA: hypothetical protein ENH94_07000, partial [Phycisphaerales bacterium]|nr:hypothetical protein [Phycisphaerales bacterium]
MRIGLIDIEPKSCEHCGEVLPEGSTRAKRFCSSACKKKQWRAKNKEHVAVYLKQWKEANSEAVKASHQATLAKQKADKEAKRTAMPCECCGATLPKDAKQGRLFCSIVCRKEKNREDSRLYYQANKEKCKESSRRT